MIVVSDTSPITSLMQVGQLDVLEAMYTRVLIPRSVERELVRSHPTLPAFLEIRDVADRPAVQRLSLELDLGEAEAIVLAKETQASLLLIDERPGRAVALREGVRIAGLLGVLVEAKHQGLIRSFRDLLSDLESCAGFRVAEHVKTEALRAAGEL